tara:strand:+ start:4516 stop:7524 length:3009 start_codon:yes stop_codon:yes gene_type:complete
MDDSKNKLINDPLLNINDDDDDFDNKSDNSIEEEEEDDLIENIEDIDFDKIEDDEIEYNHEIYHVEDEILKPIEIAYIPHNKELLIDKPVINVFNDDDLSDYIYDLFDNYEGSRKLFLLYKKTIDNEIRERNDFFHSKFLSVYIDNNVSYKQEHSHLLDLQPDLQRINLLNKYDEINERNMLFFPFEFESVKKTFKPSERTQLIFNINDQKRKYNIDESSHNIYIHYDRTKFRYKTSEKEILINRINKIKEDEFDTIPPIKDFEFYDEINEEGLRLNKGFYEFEIDDLKNLTFKDEKEYKDKDLKNFNNHLKSFIIPDDFFHKIDYNQFDIKSVNDEINTLNNNNINVSLDYTNPTEILEAIKNGKNIEEIKENIEDYLRMYDKRKGVEFLNELIKNKDSTIIQQKIQLFQNRFSNLFLQDYQDNTKDFIIPQNQFLEILEGDKDVNSYGLFKYLHVDEDEFEEKVLLTEEKSLQIDFNKDKIITYYNAINKAFSQKLINILPIIYQFILDSNIDLDLDKIIENIYNLTNDDLLYYFIIEIYFILQQNVIDDEEIFLNAECFGLFKNNSEPPRIEDNKVKFNLSSDTNKRVGLLPYIICVFELQDDFKNKNLDVLNNIAKILVAKYNKRLDDINVLFKLKLEQNKKTINYKNAIINLKDSPNDYNYVQALLYMPGSTSQKQINKYVSGCCKQKISIDFKAFSDISSDDTKLKYIHNYMNNLNLDTKKIWKPYSIIKEEDKEEDTDEDKKEEDTDEDKKDDDTDDHKKEDTDDEKEEDKDIIEILKENIEILDKYEITDKMLNDFKSKKRILEDYVSEKTKDINNKIKKSNPNFEKFIDLNDMDRLISIIYEKNENINDEMKELITLYHKINNFCSSKEEEILKVNIIKKIIILLILLNHTKLDEIYDKIISSYKYFKMPTLKEHQDFVSKIREEYKRKTLDILEKADKDEKLLLKELKNMGVYNYMDEIDTNTQNVTKNMDYKTDQDNKNETDIMSQSYNDE